MMVHIMLVNILLFWSLALNMTQQHDEFLNNLVLFIPPKIAISFNNMID